MANHPYVHLAWNISCKLECNETLYVVWYSLWTWNTRLTTGRSRSIKTNEHGKPESSRNTKTYKKPLFSNVCFCRVIIIIIIMLAYLYCAPLTPGWQWTSPYHPVNRGPLHLTMMGRECSWLDPSYQRHITFACAGCYQLHAPITVQALLLLPTYCRYQFTNPERMDSLVS